MKKLLYILIGIILGTSSIAYGAVAVVQVINGGTGKNTLTTSQLIYGNGTAPVQTVATTSVSCSGTVSCTGFTIIGSSPITLTGSASGGSGYPFALTGNATSTLTQFNAGLTAYASSTIGNGTQTGGLTISGSATSTILTLSSNGSATAPAIRFISNPKTGFYYPGSGVGVTVNGVENTSFTQTSTEFFQTPIFDTITGSTQCLQADSSGIVTGTASPCSSSSAGGSDTDVQFNDGGTAFGGVSNFTFDKTNSILTLGPSNGLGEIVGAGAIGATDDGGSLAIVGGNGGGTSGLGGEIDIDAGNANGGNDNGGNVNIAAGQQNGSGNPGEVSINTFNANSQLHVSDNNGISILGVSGSFVDLHTDNVSSEAIAQFPDIGGTTDTFCFQTKANCVNGYTKVLFIGSGNSSAGATTTVASLTIPSNVFGANKMIRIYAEVYNQRAGNSTCGYDIAFGNGTASTTVATLSLNNIGNDYLYGQMNADIFATTTTSQITQGFSPVGTQAGSDSNNLVNRLDTTLTLLSHVRTSVNLASQSYISFATKLEAGSGTCFFDGATVELLSQ